MDEDRRRHRPLSHFDDATLGIIMPRIRVFLDESGECKCSTSSAYEHFAITALSVPEASVGELKTRFKQSVADLVNSGWKKGREVKAADVYNDRHFGGPAVAKTLQELEPCTDLRVSYVVVRKDGLISPTFRAAPYGIMYNYFAGVLLSGMVEQDGVRDIHLTYDRRNKESHNKKHFEDYLRTLIFGQAFEAGIEVALDVVGQESHMSHGLGAVDFFCWAVFRRFERGDASFLRQFEARLGFKQEWYTKQH